MTRRDRLSALDALFLPMETDTQALHIGSLLLIEGPAPEPAAFRQHVVAALAGLRRRVLRMPLDLGRPMWVDATDFDPADQVHHVVLDAPGDDEQLRALVTRIMSTRLDASRPLWELWQVCGLTDGRWAVVAKAHHTVVDGQSGADVVRTLLTDDATVVPPPTVDVDPARPAPSLAGLGLDLASWLACLPVRVVRLLLGALSSPRRATRRVRLVRAGVAQVLRPDLPPSVLTGPLGPERIWGWAEADLAVLTQVARAAACTVNDVFLAALTGGYRRYLLERGEPLACLVLRAIVPVAGRADGRRKRPGNLASAMFVELPVQLTEPAARLAAVRARTAAQKAGQVAEATAAVVHAADHIPAPLLAWGARAYGRSGQGRVNVVASNVAGPARAQYLAGRRVLELVPYVPTAQEVRASVAMVSYAGLITIGITADAAALPDADRLVAAVGQELTALATRVR